MISPDAFSPLPDCDLPVFYQAHGEFVLFYAPGYLAVVARERAWAFADDVRQNASAGETAVTHLRRYAQQAQQKWHEMPLRPFAPICLTLYLNNECNLGCTYCYANPTPHPAPRLSLCEIRAGATTVAQNCLARGERFTVVFHGGGEPMLHLAATQQALDEIERIANNFQLPLFRYIATNGVISVDKAQWMAKRFDLIGLSCDGPPAIQARQRPLWGGGASTSYVERTAQIVHEAHKPLHVRVTITPQSFPCQAEIATYICRQLRPQEIHVEPVYQAGRAQADDCMAVAQAEAFVAEFLKARVVAQAYGTTWTISGSRPWDIHGPYCHVFRDVLNIVPGGAATACFKTTTAAQTRQQRVMIGELATTSEHFVLDVPIIQSLRQRLRLFPAKCDDCFNQYHCVRDCPDHCPLDGLTPASEFGCQVQQRVVNALLWETAVALRAAHPNETDVVSGPVTLT